MKKAMANQNDVAVIGMSCRFPDGHDPEAYWDSLCRGRVSIREIPPDRWRWQQPTGDPQPEENSSRFKWGAFLENVDCFDRAFFAISAREAESMDPQQRLGLELAWTCLENAGIAPSKLSGQAVGVFVGAANLDYKEIIEAQQENIDAHYASGIGASVIANRLSFYFNFRGPSMAIDTACSSSLYAIHAATQALRGGECTLALAGGVSLLLTPRRFVCFSKAGMLSPTGALRSFDNAADGMVRGEGGGLILLKRLGEAEADGDTILGIVKGSAVNHNGRTYSLTYPDARSQASVIVAAREAAGVRASDVSYLEAHGTGTPKGDPIELEGIRLANTCDGNGGYSLRAGESSCGVGSAKANIGHLEAASGIAGVIKIMLAMRHRVLPPLAGFTTLNARTDLAGSGLRIIDKPEPWHSSSVGVPLTAGVSSFGFAGTNAHIVLQAAPEPDARKVEVMPAHILCLAAKTPEALLRKQHEMLAWLKSNKQRFTAYEVCAVSMQAREHFAVRCAVTGTTTDELISNLDDGVHGRPNSYYFAGQGTPGEEDDAGDENSAGSDVKDLSLLQATAALEYLGIIGNRYVNGEHPGQWMLYRTRSHVAAALPAYPFEKIRCWVSPRSPDPAPCERTQCMDPTGKPSDIILTPLGAFAESTEGEVRAPESVNPSIDDLLERIYEGAAGVDNAVEALTELVVNSA